MYIVREILVVFFKNKKIQRDYFLEQNFKIKKKILKQKL